MFKKIIRSLITLGSPSREPKPTTPTKGIISPASGRVIEVRKSPNTEIIFEKQGITNHVALPEISGPVWVVVIEMTLSDVHVQRAPINGVITRISHYDGYHKNALGKERLDLVEENEKVIAVFTNNDTTVGVVQVAGRAARRIRTYTPIGSSIETGAVYGKILLGSQVVVIIPEKHIILVDVDDRVINGESIIAN